MRGNKRLNHPDDIVQSIKPEPLPQHKQSCFDYMSPVTLNLKIAIQFVDTTLKLMMIIAIPSLATKGSAVQMILSGKTLTEILILYCDCYVT